MKLAEYQELVAKDRRKNDDPEHQLQRDWCVCIGEVLPPVVDWTANAAGVRVTPRTAAKMKEAGVRRGWGDLQFLFPDRITRYIEAKVPGVGRLSAEQKAMRDRWSPLGIWEVANCWDQVEEALARWCAENRLVLGPLNPITRARFGR